MVKTITPKIFKKNCKIALEKSEKDLIKVILEEESINEEKKNILSQIKYWKGMLK